MGQFWTSYTALKEEESPIFLQFIDCVYQLLCQYPTEFGFNEEFLRTVLEHFYSCKFGTFLANSELEQKDLRLREKTVSLWTWTNHPQNLKKFENPFFAFSKRFASKNNSFLHATSSMDQLAFWSDMYNGPERIKHEKKEACILRGVRDLSSEIEKLKLENLELKKRLERENGEDKKVDEIRVEEKKVDEDCKVEEKRACEKKVDEDCKVEEKRACDKKVDEDFKVEEKRVCEKKVDEDFKVEEKREIDDKRGLMKGVCEKEDDGNKVEKG